MTAQQERVYRSTWAMTVGSKESHALEFTHKAHRLTESFNVTNASSQRPLGVTVSLQTHRSLLSLLTHRHEAPGSNVLLPELGPVEGQRRLLEVLPLFEHPPELPGVAQVVARGGVAPHHKQVRVFLPHNLQRLPHLLLENGICTAHSPARGAELTP